MTYKDLIKRLKQEGWYIKNSNGSHVHMINEKYNKKITVPNHGSKDLKKGTLRQILKSAGL